MAIGWLLERMAGWRDRPALVWKDRSATYGELLGLVESWQARLTGHHLAERVVALCGGYSPNACGLLLALIEARAVAVPLTDAVGPRRAELLDVAQVEAAIWQESGDRWTIEQRPVQVDHPLLLQLRQASRPGLVLFSSGSTGQSKAALHDFLPLLEKFQPNRQRLCTLTFLLLDHIGGINTLLYTLANGGTAVAVGERDPDTVCQAIERYRVELLPTSPTFLNLLLISEAYQRYDLSSLRLVTYGTEVMPETTLRRMRQVLPAVRFQQTYGLSEVGILRSRSLDSDSLWVKVGGEGYETRIVDDQLWVRAKSRMLGYLNAASPFDQEGWLNTGDLVEQRGDYLRILGRKSDMINVGGQKVYPAEVQSALLQLDNVRDAVVFGEPNPIMGQVVAARINLFEPEEPPRFRARLRAFLRTRLEPYKVPVRIELVDYEQFNARYKRTVKTPDASN